MFSFHLDEYVWWCKLCNLNSESEGALEIKKTKQIRLEKEFWMEVSCVKRHHVTLWHVYYILLPILSIIQKSLDVTRTRSGVAVFKNLCGTAGPSPFLWGTLSWLLSGSITAQVISDGVIESLSSSGGDAFAPTRPERVTPLIRAGNRPTNQCAKQNGHLLRRSTDHKSKWIDNKHTTP